MGRILLAVMLTAAAVAPADAAPRSFRDCPECPQMVEVPAGAFTMGSPAGEPGRDVDEGPQHRVTITRPFAAGRCEVTFAEWDACAAAGGCRLRPSDQGWGRADRPVIDVSWNDARAYVRWLGLRTGKPYRLLSEAEWEYAARAGTTTTFHFGDRITTGQANFDGDHTYRKSRRGIFRERTLPVGRFPANAFGLHDVHGNVSEWVGDCWQPDYSGAPVDGSASTAGDCRYRVIRGGAWLNIPGSVRSALRIEAEPGHVGHDLGFRVARDLP